MTDQIKKQNKIESLISIVRLLVTTYLNDHKTVKMNKDDLNRIMSCPIY